MSRVVSPDGIELAVSESGDPANPTVLLVHGYPDTHRIWDAIRDLLAADHHVVRYDVRGAGHSQKPSELAAYRLQRLADDLFAVATAVSSGRPVHVAGHDWGSVQAWHAVTSPAAAGRIASFTSISGPCLDHAAYWFRRRLASPSPRRLHPVLRQAAMSWYITAFRLPWLAPFAWRHGLARRWPITLDRDEAALADDAIRGLSLYRANMRHRTRHPEPRIAQVPVQLITLSRDRYLSPALVSEDLDRWAPQLTRHTLDATHWSALTDQAPAVAALIRQHIAASSSG
jgi:pimeloyl-ACP methyl ester carboxylesterase